MLKWMTAFMLCLMATAPAQADKAPDFDGVWTGTIGTYPVNACFAMNDDFKLSNAAYYYLSKKKLIPLQAGDDQAWGEGDDPEKPDATWKIKLDGADNISGTWTGKDKSLDVKLHRIAKVAADDDNGACGSDAFFKPRLTTPKITEAPKDLDGHAYTEVKVDAGPQFDVEFSTFKLPGEGAAIAAVNKQLLVGVPENGEKPGYLECLQGAMTMAHDGDYAVELSPKIITSHFLAVSSSDGSFCGGAHPVNSATEQVYDLRSGKLLELRNWMNKGLVDKDDKIGGGLEKALLEKFASDKDVDKECLDAIKDVFAWGISLDKTGMAFLPELPYAEIACGNTVVLSFDEAEPFLNAEGKKQLADFKSEVAK